MKDKKAQNAKKANSTKKKLRIAGIFALLCKKLGSKKKAK